MNSKVLIIIIVHNGAEYLGDCFSSLSKITYPKGNFKILVIDNGSNDSSVDHIKKNWTEITLIENRENLGFAQANNIGMQYGIKNNFDHVYLLNQDTVVEPNFLEEAVKLAESNPKIGAVQSKLLLYHNQGKINSIGNEIHFLGFAFAGGYQQPDFAMEPKDITYPAGASVLIKISALKDIGLFNSEFFMYHEDVDLGWRLWLMGYKVMLAPQSIVYHKYEFSRSIKKYYYMERNRYLTILQNYRFLTLLLISPACLIMDIAMFFYSFFAGWWHEELKVWDYFLKPSSWRQIFRNRAQIQKNRRVGDRIVVRRFVGKIEFQDLENPILRYIANPILNWYWQVIKRLIWW